MSGTMSGVSGPEFCIKEASKGWRVTVRACLVWTAAVLVVFACAALFAASAVAQGSRKDDVVFGPTGHPVANATVMVCMPTATGTPCSAARDDLHGRDIDGDGGESVPDGRHWKLPLLRAGGTVHGAD